MNEADFIISSFEEKWREHLEMLPPEQQSMMMSKILAQHITKLQVEIRFLERKQCTPK